MSVLLMSQGCLFFVIILCAHEGEQHVYSWSTKGLESGAQEVCVYFCIAYFLELLNVYVLCSVRYA